ncbi:hypothetical protein GCM10010231_63480 [Streptomyces sindenensis]|nr:hypothetical protein GCM10010231_63480 [Streptomyces sindenensis]
MVEREELSGLALGAVWSVGQDDSLLGTASAHFYRLLVPGPVQGQSEESAPKSGVAGQAAFTGLSPQGEVQQLYQAGLAGAVATVRLPCSGVGLGDQKIEAAPELNGAEPRIVSAQKVLGN